jgi:GH15 family glucan-1,4-alpha-glucosidase
MYKKISDYGVIGNLHTVALVSSKGSIDYCSLPYINSPTVFAALLDDEKGGTFSIQPSGNFKSSHKYIKNTNLLSCRFTTKSGLAQLIDFMPVNVRDPSEIKAHLIHRCLKVTSGHMDFVLRMAARPEYAKELPRINRDKNIFSIRLRDYVFTFILRLKEYEVKKYNEGDIEIHFTLKKNQQAHFDFIYGGNDINESASCPLEETRQFWLNWIHHSKAGKSSLKSKYDDMVMRSLLVLKLLFFASTGSMAAAATTSLPEAIGFERNWDYRFSWLRDASFALKVLFIYGHHTEALSYEQWLYKTFNGSGSKKLQIMYSLEGNSKLTEKELTHLKGYKKSKPVRVGNLAYTQNQWDIYGEVMDIALRLSDYTERIEESLWPFYKEICTLAKENWQKPDRGIWEMRGTDAHYVYSKVMCWVAIDRGIKIAERHKLQAPLEQWNKTRDKIKEEVLEKGFDKGRNSFMQSYGSKEIDASLLLLGLMDFLPMEDERIQGTISTCRRHLMDGGFVRRYKTSDNLKGSEGAFVLCNFWLVECLALSGNIQDAEALLEKSIEASNSLGLFSEEYDPRKKQMLGNFPQAISHIGFVNAVTTLNHVRRKNRQS